MEQILSIVVIGVPFYLTFRANKKTHKVRDSILLLSVVRSHFSLVGDHIVTKYYSYTQYILSDAFSLKVELSRRKQWHGKRGRGISI